MTIHLSNGKECLLTWLDGMHLNMTNGSLNALTYNSGTPIINTLRQHLVVDPTIFKVLIPGLVPPSTPSAMDAQTHLPTLRLSCPHGQSILHTNFQDPTRFISHNQEIPLISTSRASIFLTNQDLSRSWHNLYPLTARCPRLFHRSQSNPEHIRD